MNNIGPHDFDGLLVVASLRNDEVGMAFGRLDELFVHRLQDVEITVEHHLGRSSSLDSIALDDADESLVRVGINEDFQVHEVAQLLLPQRHNTFDDDDFARLDVYRLWQSVADQVAVSGLLNALPLSQSLYLLGQKLPVEGVGMVEVDAFALLGRQMRRVVVVGILWNERYSVCGKRLENLLYDCCFARASASSDADDIHLRYLQFDNLLFTICSPFGGVREGLYCGFEYAVNCFGLFGQEDAVTFLVAFEL